MHVGQPEIPAGVAVRQSLVVEAHQVQDGRVQVVDMHGIFNRLETEVIRGAVDQATFHTAPRQPERKTVMIMVAAQRPVAAFQ